MNSIKVCEYSRSRSFHDDLILQDQASGERSQDQWSSGLFVYFNDASCTASENSPTASEYEPLHEKTNSLGQHKLTCTVTEAG